jgi:hypothetical protein
VRSGCICQKSYGALLHQGYGRGVRAGLTALVASSLLAGCTGDSPDPADVDGSATHRADSLSCARSVEVGPLPTWARAGFTPPGQSVPHLTGAAGDIVGVVFGDPLEAPPPTDHQNKILWVSRVAAGGDPDLKIRASLGGADLVVHRRVVGGAGPSVIDMPRAGCWSFQLAWSRFRDRLTVPYSR